MLLVYNILYMPEEEEYDEGQNKDGLTRDPSLSVSDNAQSGWGDKYFQNSLAKNVGRNAEKNATGNVVKFPGYGRSSSEKKDGGTGGGNVIKGDFTSARQDAKSAEEKGGFVNNVQGKAIDAAMSGVPGGKVASKQLKKLGPAGLILAIVAVLMIVFSGTQTLAPFGLVANGLDQFNNLRTSMNKRTPYFNRFSLDRNHKTVRGASIFNDDKFKISNSLSKKLKSNNIYYFKDKSKYDVDFLVYEDEDSGKKYAVAANDKDVGKLPDSVEIDGKKVEISKGGKMKLDDALVDSDNFSTSMDKGTRTLKGHIAGWFDDLSAKLHLRFRSSRNKFKNTKKNADDAEVVENAKSEGLYEGIKGDNGDYEKGDEDDPESKRKFKVCDDDGCSYPDGKDSGDEAPHKSGSLDKSSNVSEGEITNVLKTKMGSVISGIGTGADIGCAVMKAFGAINAIVGAMHVAQVINYLSGFLEAIQKTQAGDAGKTELSHYMTGLSQKGATVNSLGKVIKGKENTSSLESPAWNQFFSDGELTVQPNDEAAEKFNREYTMQNAIANFTGFDTGVVQLRYGFTSRAISAFMNGAEAYKTCLYIDSAATAASAAVDIVFAFMTGGIGSVIKSLTGGDVSKMLFSKVVGAAVSLAISMIASTVIPHIARILTTDLISNMAGEDAAYAINSGFNIYGGQQLQMSSGLPATEDKLMSHYRAQQEVIASEGEYERSQRNPFDPTSKYTFVGSIVNSLMPIANALSSPLSIISSSLKAVGNSLSSLSPTAAAAGETKFKSSINHNCPNLKNIGLVGDAYCNPYIVTDMSTMSTDPATVFEKARDTKDDADSEDNFLDEDDEGNPQINPQGDLAKWVVSCAVRDSDFGTVDSNVMSAITTMRYGISGGTLTDIVDAGVSALPVVGDVHDIMSNASELKNMGWATGEKCKQDKYKYFSRYSEDQRMMESAGIIKKSAVAAFLDKYYEQNPIDDSFEGTIARYSGMKKSDVEDVIALIKYADFVSRYDPVNYGPEKAASVPKYRISKKGNIDEMNLVTVFPAKIYFSKREKLETTA